jgi:hypothetical protein
LLTFTRPERGQDNGLNEAQNEDDWGDKPVTVCDLRCWHVLAPGLYRLGHCSRAIRGILASGIVLRTTLRKGWTMGGEANVIMLSRGKMLQGSPQRSNMFDQIDLRRRIRIPVAWAYFLVRCVVLIIICLDSCLFSDLCPVFERCTSKSRFSLVLRRAQTRGEGSGRSHAKSKKNILSCLLKSRTIVSR